MHLEVDTQALHDLVRRLTLVHADLQSIDARGFLDYEALGDLRLAGSLRQLVENGSQGRARLLDEIVTMTAAVEAAAKAYAEAEREISDAARPVVGNDG